jgi:hypothetical protein
MEIIPVQEDSSLPEGHHTFEFRRTTRPETATLAGDRDTPVHRRADDGVVEGGWCPEDVRW